MSSSDAALEAWSTAPATEIGAAIGRGEVDPVALTEAYLARAETVDGVYVRTTADRARRTAEAARDRARAGLRRSPLDGVPISWKDLFDLAGAPTEAGSRLCAGRIAARDAEAAARAERAGLPPLGKTHLSELAFSGLGYNPIAATAPNRFDGARLPGGSSSGAAASLAFGLCAAAIGSDTGGSVRIPAAWNGLVGLKTTFGLIPNDGVSPLSPSLDTIGPLTRTVADAAAVYAILADRPAPDLAGATLSGAVFLAPETVMTEDLDPEVASGFAAALERLKDAGARIDHAPVPEFAEFVDIAAREGSISNTEGYGVWGAAIEANPGVMFPLIEARFKGGLAVSGVQADRARLGFQRLAASYLARTAGYDAVIAPTSPIRAPLIAEVADDADAYVRLNALALRNTRIGNFFGLSALALPTARLASGHPGSLMAMGRPFEEGRLLRVGAAIEGALT